MKFAAALILSMTMVWSYTSGHLIATFGGNKPNGYKPGDPVPLPGIEIVSPLNQPLPTCIQKTYTLPANVQFNQESAGGNVKGNLIVCGGLIANLQVSQDCYTFNMVTKQLVAAGGKLSQARLGFASAYNDVWGLVMSGGYVDLTVKPPTLSNAVDVTMDGVTVTQLKNTPVQITDHCMAIIDNDRLMIVGGDYAANAKSTYIFSKSANTWTKVLDMNTARVGASCASVQNPFTKKMMVVVAGGSLYGFFDPKGPTNILDTVEIWSDDGTNKWWASLNRMPTPSWYGVSLPVYNTMAVVGGMQQGGAIHQFNEWCGTWFSLPGKLSRDMPGLSAVKIPIPTCSG